MTTSTNHVSAAGTTWPVVRDDQIPPRLLTRLNVIDPARQLGQ